MTPDPRLLLPATRALLEGWCGPVVAELHLGRVEAVVLDDVVVHLDSLGQPRVNRANPDHLSLDLSRAECWMRVCWVLWRHVGAVSVDMYGQTPLVDSPSLTDDTHWVVTRRLRVGEMVVHEERADAPGVLFALGDDAADPLLSLAAVARQVLTPGGSDAR